MNALSTLDLINQWGIILMNPQKKSDAELLKKLFELPHLVKVDQIESQVADLIKLNNPTKSFSKEELLMKVVEFFEMNEKHSYGQWVFYPWKNTLVHVLPEREFIQVRTVRNQYKITPSEQEKLSTKKIGIVGLSVGQSVAMALALERGCGELRLADFDTLELSNMNRIRCSLTELGLKKSTIAAREILEIDPYLKVTVYEEGINEGNIVDFFTKGGELDLLVDECDSLDIKVLLREVAKKYRIPVIMDTSDRGMLDIERFDLEPERPVFHGFLGDIDYKDLKDLNIKEKVTYGLKITGLETLSPRMKASLLEINQTISSWPQLASAVFLGGALGAHSARNILLDQMTESGRFFIDLDELVQVHSGSENLKFKVNEEDLNFSVQKEFELKSSLSSNYKLTEDELIKIVKVANTAPSGGNCQPWSWVFDEKGVLHLYHDKKRSESLLDFKGTGSLMSFGSALENIRLTCAQMGIETEMITEIVDFEEEKIASIIFKNKQKQSINVPFAYLTPYIERRLTDRQNQKRQIIDREIFKELVAIAEESGLNLHVFDQEDQIGKLAKINGVMDWVRMINEEGYRDFVKEIRWNSSEAEMSKDGMDLSTFDLSVADKAILKMINNPKAMKFVREHHLGRGFTQISDKTFQAASAICLLSAKDFSPDTYLKAGRALQRIWTHANMKKISFQPVTAPLFLYQQYIKGDKKRFSAFESNLIKNSLREFREFVQHKNGEVEIFLFRLNITEGDVVRSLRRDVVDTLKIV